MAITYTSAENTVPAKIGDNLTVDVLLAKETRLESNVSENPVETGFIISDHVQKKPLKLSLDVVFTPTTLSGDGAMIMSFFGASGTNNRGRLVSVMNQLFDLYKKGEPIQIVLPDTIYDNMIMIVAPIPRTVEDGICYKTRLEFQQVDIVEAKSESIPPETAGEDVEEMAGDTEQDFGEAEVEEIQPTNNIGGRNYEYYGVKNEEEYQALYGSKNGSLVADTAADSVDKSLGGNSID